MFGTPKGPRGEGEAVESARLYVVGDLGALTSVCRLVEIPPVPLTAALALAETRTQT